MVVINEVKSMFWGVTLDGGKRYSQTVDQSFHISMAAIEASQQQKNPVSVMIEHNNAEFVLCTLEPGKIYQQPLDLNFTEGEELALYLNGKGCVHLTGYLVEDDMGEPPYDDSMGEEESSEEEEDVPALKEAAKVGDDDDEDDSEDDDFNPSLLLESDEEESESDEEVDSDEVEEAINAKRKMKEIEHGLKKKKKLEAETVEDESEDDDLDEEDDEIEEESPKKNKSKIETPSKLSKKPDVPQNGSGDASSKKKKKKKKKNKDNKDNAENQNTPAKGPKKQVISGNIIIEENKEGHGQVAKSGCTAHVYYVGKLQNGKQFDSQEKGKPFAFSLGKGEVIKGWDLGVQGMKVGGRRRITVPPKMGYGNQKMGPIPKNSTLVFDVELKAVS